MIAVIKEHKKHPKQPTNAETFWCLMYLPNEAKVTDNVMGWISSGDTKQQLHLEFDTLKQAETYAKAEGLNYKVQKLPDSQKCQPISKRYVDIYR